MIRRLSEKTAGPAVVRLGGLAESLDQEREHAREVLSPAVECRGGLSRFFRVDDDEAIPIRHLDLMQGLSIHLVVCADDAVQSQDVRGNGIYLFVR